MTPTDTTPTPPTDAEWLALFALMAAVQWGHGYTVDESLDAAAHAWEHGGGIEERLLGPLARRLAAAIRSEALHDAASIARDHAAHHAANAEAAQDEDERFDDERMALACADVARDLCAVSREETDDAR